VIVGHFEAGGAAFESEVWGDVDQFMSAFGRPVFSSLTLRLTSRSGFRGVQGRVEQDPRTQARR